ncbi:hypothetical protein [Escherichia coli]|uniref:hypothetical protein n=1 Tax=Escherichia coli TaxID=562 RepID=UPI0024C103EF|nr:hypothetical protein [Escherichia coli]
MVDLETVVLHYLPMMLCKKNWVLVGVLTGDNEKIANWNVIPTDYLNQVMQDDFDAPVDFVSGLAPLNWTYDKTSGTGTLSQGSKNWTMHGQKDRVTQGATTTRSLPLIGGV